MYINNAKKELLEKCAEIQGVLACRSLCRNSSTTFSQIIDGDDFWKKNLTDKELEEAHFERKETKELNEISRLCARAKDYLKSNIRKYVAAMEDQEIWPPLPIPDDYKLANELGEFELQKVIKFFNEWGEKVAKLNKIVIVGNRVNLHFSQSGNVRDRPK